MTVEELIRELSSAEGFYNDVELVKSSEEDFPCHYSKKYNYHVEIDNGVVYIVIEDK